MLAMNLPIQLTVEEIVAQRSGVARNVDIEVVAVTASTNSDLMARLPVLQHPLLLVAEQQTAGRGRAGRSWLSGTHALTFSLAWPFAQTPQQLLGLPLAVGTALAQALVALEVPVQLKWPNDVLKEGKKLAGILVETAVHQRQTWAVIGIGLNLQIPLELEALIGQPVADATWLAQMDRNRLLAILLDQLVTALTQFGSEGMTPFVASWNSLHAYAGQLVNLVDHGQIIRQGRALGIDAQGCLLMQGDDGSIHRVMVGDVSLRLE